MTAWPQCKEVPFLRGNAMKTQIYGWLHNSICRKENRNNNVQGKRKRKPKNRNETKNTNLIERVITWRWFQRLDNFIMFSVLFLNAVWLQARHLTSLGLFLSLTCFEYMIHVTFYKSIILVVYYLYTHILIFNMFIDFPTAKDKCVFIANDI